MAAGFSFDALAQVPDLLAVAEQHAAVETLAEEKVGLTSEVDEEDRRALQLIANCLAMRFWWAAHAIADALRVELDISPSGRSS